MAEPKTTIKTFQNEAEAELARQFLERHGIAATVHRFSRYRAMTGGGYLLKVEKSRSAEASKFLKIDSEIDLDEYIDPDDESYPRCPTCRSANTISAPLTWPQMIVVLLGLGIPAFFIKRAHTCRKCGAAWRQ